MLSKNNMLKNICALKRGSEGFTFMTRKCILKRLSVMRRGSDEGDSAPINTQPKEKQHQRRHSARLLPRFEREEGLKNKTKQQTHIRIYRECGIIE